MGKKKANGLLNIEKARAAGASFEFNDKFAAVTIPADGFQKLIGFTRNGVTWTHKNFKD